MFLVGYKVSTQSPLQSVAPDSLWLSLQQFRSAIINTELSDLWHITTVTLYK